MWGGEQTDADFDFGAMTVPSFDAQELTSMLGLAEAEVVISSGFGELVRSTSARTVKCF